MCSLHIVIYGLTVAAPVQHHHGSEYIHTRTGNASHCAGDERSLYKTLLALRRQRPASGRGPMHLLTCARVTALGLSFAIGLLLVLATRHPPVQEVLKGGVQRAGELLQNVRTPVEVQCKAGATSSQPFTSFVHVLIGAS